MKLTLKNFRCYKEKIFEFKDGLTLISGPSGVGKSTILMAINFAIFGTGLKLSTVGTNSCSVELEMDNIKIIRKKRPNHLIVNDKYEDDAGQSIIDKTFGDTFNITGYIDQNARNSFIMMSSVDKLGFLETFAFKDVNLKELKTKCKDQITKAQDELKDKTNKLEITKKIISELVRPDRIKLDFLDKYKSEKNKEITINNERILYKKVGKKISMYETEMNNMKQEIHDLDLLLTQIQSRQEVVNDLQCKLDKFELEYIEYESREDKTEYYQKMIQYLTKNRKIQKLKENIEENTKILSDMKIQEIKNINNKIKSIEKEVWSEYENEEDVEEQIENLRQCVKDVEQMERLREQIEDYTNDIDIQTDTLKKLRKDIEEKETLLNTVSTEKVYICPCCSNYLQFDGDKLIKTDSVPNDEYDIDLLTMELESLTLKKNEMEQMIEIYHKNNKLQIKIDKIINEWSLDNSTTVESLRGDITYLRQYIKEQHKLVKQQEHYKQNLENEEFSQSYKSFENDLNKMKTKLDKLLDMTDNAMSVTLEEGKIYELLQEERNIQDKCKTLKEELNETKHEMERNSDIISKTENKYIQKYDRIISRDYLSKQIEDKTIELKNLYTKKEYHEGRLNDIEKWLENRKELSDYNKWLTKIKDLEEDELEYRKRYAASIQLKEKIMEAESIAIKNVIHSINTHANVYLESFFSDTPISVQLQPFKETKKQIKPTINITVEYKGMEIELNMLSGGELSRVILAYTLALSEIFNTPLLMLDECTSSLDEELTNDVFSSIKEHFSEKNTLIIAHQVVTGTFDNMVIL